MGEFKREMAFRQEKSQPSQLYIRKKASSLAKYEGLQARLERHVTAFEREVERRRELENKRLLRKIAEIHRRKSSLSQGEEERKLYTLNMASRRLQRQKHDQSLQQENDIMVERIVRMRSYRSSLNAPSEEVGPRQGRRGSNPSLLLPKIDQYR